MQESAETTLRKPTAASSSEPTTRFAKEQLKSIVERIERLDEEGEAISNDKRDIYAESKGQGFDLAALKTVIARRRRRRKDPNKYEETQSIVEAYEAALWSGTENAPRARERARISKEDRENVPRAKDAA